MNDQIREKLLQVPESPGIYQMLDKDRNIIYIGKSKCLKKQVHSYFVPSPKWEKVKKMVPFIYDIEWIVTDTHLEAMLLECEKIKEIRPYFNVLMKNDGRYFYLNLEQNPRKPSLSVTYDRQEVSYGPFRRRGPMEELIQTMRNFYPLYRKDGKFELTYHIFPVAMNENEYEENYQTLCNILSQPNILVSFQNAVEVQMKELAKKQRFELAIRYRGFMENLRYLQRRLNDTRIWLTKDILYIVPVGAKYKYFYIQEGIIVHSRLYARITDNRKQAFVKAARNNMCRCYHISDKSKIDYQDILIAELQQAPESNIDLL